MKLLITGGAGLLGSALKIEAGTAFDVLAPTRSELDLENESRVVEYVQEHKPDLCIHAAAQVFGLGGHKLLPNKALLVNAKIDMNLVTAFRAHPPKRFVYVGTVASYGYPYISNTLQESDFFRGLPHHGEYGYAMAKRFGYDLVNSLSEFDTQVTYAIMTNLFGPRDNFNSHTGHVIPSLIARGIVARQERKSLEVWGKPTDTRDFLYSITAAKRLIQIASSDYAGVLNVGSGVERSIESVVQIICNYLGIKYHLSNENSPDSVSHRVLDISVLNKHFGTVVEDFENNLISTIEWFDVNKLIARS